MRFLSLADNSKRPQYAKALRYRFVHLPCQVVRHAGQVIFRFMDRHYKEVNRWMVYIKNLKFGIAYATRQEE